MKRTNHHWTALEEATLAEDIRVQGLDIAVTNFAAEHKLKRENVYNKGKRLQQGIFSSRHSKESAVIESQPAVKKEEKPKAKAEKIIIMVAKEYMNKLKVEFSEGKLTISYPKEDQLDIRFF